MIIILTMLKFALQYISPLYSLTPTSHEPIHSTHTIRRFHQYIISNHILVNDSRTSNIFTTTTIHNIAVTIINHKSLFTIHPCKPPLTVQADSMGYRYLCLFEEIPAEYTQSWYTQTIFLKNI